jgi:hypothetical protein
MIAEIQIALNTQLSTHYTGEIAWEGVPYTPTKDRAYVHASVAGRAAQIMGIGPYVPRWWTGTYQLLVSHPILSGVIPANKLARQILDIFPRGLGLNIGGSVEVLIESGSVASAYSTADFINIPVSIQWICEER